MDTGKLTDWNGNLHTKENAEQENRNRLDREGKEQTGRSA